MINDINKIKELLKEYGSPLYVLRENDFLNNYNNFVDSMKKYYDKYQISYSYKTNYAPYICKLLKEQGAYAEVVSDMEYFVAKSVGYDDKKIIYNGPIKGPANFELIKNGGIVNVDNINELESIVNYVNDNNIKASIGLRLNINIGQDFISRFGIDADGQDLQNAINIIRSNNNITIKGLHCHIGRSRSIESWTNRASVMLEIVDKYFSNEKLEYIDLGSGMFGVMEESFSLQFGKNLPSYLDYAKAIGDVFNNYYKDYSFEDKPILFTEPGTTLVNAYIDFISEVKAIKRIKGKDFVVLNCSKHNLGEVCTLKKLPITIINNSKQESVTNSSFVGYTCLEHDVMYEDYNGTIGVGDYVIFGNVGGYSNVSKPPFISPNCAMISMTNEGDRVIKRKEEFEDVLQTYVY